MEKIESIVAMSAELKDWIADNKKARELLTRLDFDLRMAGLQNFGAQIAKIFFGADFGADFRKKKK